MPAPRVTRYVSVLALVILLTGGAFFLRVLLSHSSGATDEAVKRLHDTGFKIVDVHRKLGGRVPPPRRIRVTRAIYKEPISASAVLEELKVLSPLISEFRCPSLIVGDEDVDVLAYMDNLQELKFNGRTLTDRGAATLCDLRNLRWIDIYAPQVGDAGFRWLGECSRLRWIFLPEAQIGDATIAQVAQCPELAELHVPNTSVTSASFQRLVQLRNLQVLDVSGTSIDDECAPFIARLTNLRRLDVSHTRITNMICHACGELPALTSLSVGGTRLDDNGVRKILVSCSRLQELSLQGCNVSYVGIANALRRSGVTKLDVAGTPLSAEEILLLCQNSGLVSIAHSATQVPSRLRREIDEVLTQRSKHTR